MLSRFHRMPERNGQTDKQTDPQNCYINIACQDKNSKFLKFKMADGRHITSR